MGVREVMSAMSSSALEKARKAHTRVLQVMQDPGTARNVAQILGVSESTVSRTKAAAEDVITLLYHLGFKVVPHDCTLVPHDYLQALRVMAKAHIQQPADSLTWED